MKPYNKSIELFGISATGKSYIRQKIIKKLSKNGYEIYGTREIIIRHIDEFINLNLYQNLLSYLPKEIEAHNLVKQIRFFHSPFLPLESRHLKQVGQKERIA